MGTRCAIEWVCEGMMRGEHQTTCDPAFRAYIDMCDAYYRTHLGDSSMRAIELGF